MACNKTPNVGSSCGSVWLNTAGVAKNGCFMNPEARSS
jgi:hypothetical protein